MARLSLSLLGTFQATLKDALSEYLYRETKRRPMVIPVVLE